MSDAVGPWRELERFMLRASTGSERRHRTRWLIRGAHRVAEIAAARERDRRRRAASSAAGADGEMGEMKDTPVTYMITQSTSVVCCHCGGGMGGARLPGRNSDCMEESTSRHVPPSSKKRRCTAWPRNRRIIRGRETMSAAQ